MATDSVALALYAFLLIVRCVLALRHASRRVASSAEAVTIIQPILSGDPLLEETLKRNIAAHPDARFLWMIDEDDINAPRTTEPNVRVIPGPPPRDGENPKLAKLIRALPLVTTERLIVLDDDTFMPGKLPGGSLVTGLPIFKAKQTIYERLIGGFVNGNALLTYLPAAELNLQRTINGMIYAVGTEELRALGGFAGAGHELTDDYAVARLYLRNGIPITQACTPAFVAMTVGTAAHYIRVMRRWMIFARHYFGDNRTLATFFWISLPGVLPLIGFVSNPRLWIFVLLAKALLNRLLLWRITKASSTVLDLVFEAAADLLTPPLMLLAFIRPRRLTWRTRQIELSQSSGKIEYK